MSDEDFFRRIEQQIEQPGQNEVDLDAAIEDELKRLRGAKELYKENHPFPVEEHPKFFKSLGIEAILALATGIAGVILAASRTMLIFYLSEVTLANIYSRMGIEATFFINIIPYIAAGSSLVAVEGTLLRRGFRNGRLHGQSKSHWIDLWLSFGISILANVESSVPLAPNLPELVSQLISGLLVFAIGLGAPFLAYFGSESIGAILFLWKEIVEKAKQDFIDSKKKWLSAAQSQRSTVGKKVYGEEGKNTPKPKKEKGISERQIVEDWLVENNMNASQIGVGDGNLMTPEEVAERTNVSSANVRNILSRLRAKGETA